MTPNTIYHGVSLKPYHTFHLASVADNFVAVDCLEGLKLALKYAKENGLKPHFLGGGSNTIFSSHPTGLIIKIEFKGLEIEEMTDGSARVTVASGEELDKTIATLINEGIFGLENLSAIPGCIGGAAVQNVGAYGVEFAEYVESVEIFDGEILRSLKIDELDFGYRTSIFKSEIAQNWVIMSVTFRFSREWVPNLQYKELDTALADVEDDDLTATLIRETVTKIRARKLPDPEKLGNAGSFFKNPIVSKEQAWALLEVYPQLVYYPMSARRYKIAAGWLMDVAGLKGLKKGHLAVYDKHALILVNEGGATGEDLINFKDEIVAKIKDEFGITFEMEPVLVI